MSKLIKWLIAPVIAVPAVYLGIVWKQLPDRVPVHFNIEGQPDRYGSKTELLVVLAVMIVVNLLVYLLLTNIHRIDPKRKYAEENMPKMRRLAFAVACFLSAISCIIILSTLRAGFSMGVSYILVAVGLLFSFIGNYMYTIKPNYFAGLRLPWTLENEENWRKTHQVAGKLWFGGGLLLAMLALVLPDKAAFIVFLAGGALLVMIPVIYSFRLYQMSRHQQ